MGQTGSTDHTEEQGDPISSTTRAETSETVSLDMQAQVARRAQPERVDSNNEPRCDE